MQRILIVLFLLTLYNISYSQDLEFFEYEIDKLVKVNMPGEEVYELDTIVNGIKLYQLYTTIDDAMYVAQKTEVEKNNTDKNLSTLPHDKSSLNEYYSGFASGMKNGSKSELLENYEIEKNGLIGQKVIIFRSDKKPFCEAEIFLINNHIYTISYYSDENIESENKQFYLNSFSINTEIKINQFSGTPRSQRIAYLLGKYTFYLVFLIGVIILIVKLSKRKK